jgi:flagellar hook-length control protein FliK
MINASLKTGSPIQSRRDPEMASGAEMNRSRTQADDFSREMTSVLQQRRDPRIETPVREKVPSTKKKNRSGSDKEATPEASPSQDNSKESGAVSSAETTRDVKKTDSAEKSSFDSKEEKVSSDEAKPSECSKPAPEENPALSAGVPGIPVKMPEGDSPSDAKDAASPGYAAVVLSTVLEKQKTEGAAAKAETGKAENGEDQVQINPDGPMETTKDKGSPVSADGIPAAKGTESSQSKGVGAFKAALLKEEEGTVKAEDLSEPGQDPEKAGTAKSTGLEGVGKTVKGKGGTQKEAAGLSALFAGIPVEEAAPGEQAASKGLEFLKAGMAADEGSKTTFLTDEHEARSGADSKHSDDSGLKQGEGKGIAPGQPFRFSEAVEDSKSFDRVSENKMTQTASSHETREAGFSTPQSFTIKNHGPSSMALVLEPEGLGKLDIELKVTHEQIHGHILVHDAKGKDLIEHNLPHLLSEMASEGLQIGQFTVSLKNQGREHYQSASSHSEARSESTKLEESGIVHPLSLENNLIHIII